MPEKTTDPVTAAPGAPTSGADEAEKADKEGRGGKVVLWTIVALVVLVGGGYAAAWAAAGDDLPRGTTIAGVRVGGLAPAAAEEALREELGDRTSRLVTLVVAESASSGEQRVQVSPAEAGLSVDYAGSVEAAGGGRSWAPTVLWDHFTGGEDLDAELIVDEERFAGALAAAEREVGQEPRDGDVAFTEAGRLDVTDPATGLGFGTEVDDAVQLAATAEDREVPVELVAVDPEVDEGDLAEALDGFANPAVSGPVTLMFGDQPVRLAPAEFARVLAMKPQRGELEPVLDEERLAEVVGARVGDEGAPVDATVVLRDGRPRVVPAKPGVSFEPDDISDVFLELVASEPEERTAEVPSTVAEPDVTTAEARAWGIKEKVSEFSTFYPDADYRNVNLGRAGELVDGTVLEPGETFSMNDTVGERTRENGFTEGFIIADGIFREDLGGGVSQMATTLFNAMFFAGLEDVEHKPHSFYIDRYPVGREATVVWGALDLRFRNDTDHGVLIDVEVTPSVPGGTGEVRVAMWSTKTWDIESITSDRYNFTQPATRVLTTPDCYPNAGYGGFDVDVTRVFREAGESEVVRRELFRTTYTPSDTVECRQPEPEGGRTTRQ